MNLRRVWPLFTLALLVGCGAARQEQQMESLQLVVADLRTEVVRCRDDIKALRGEQRALKADLVKFHKDAVLNAITEVISAGTAALKRTGPLPDSGKVRRPPVTPTPLGTPYDASRWIKKVGRHRYTIARKGLERALGNAALLARSARIVPAIRNGRPSGFKLYAIRPGSFYSALGLKDGDTLEAVNGQPIDTPARALELYTRLRKATLLKPTVRRGTRVITFVYRIIP